MNDSLATIIDLKRHGRFAEALRLLETGRFSNRSAVDAERLELLERVGDYERCRRLAQELGNARQLPAERRAVCEFVLGHIALEDGSTEDAVTLLQRAASFAREVKNIELLCKALMKLLIVVVDRSGPDAASPILSELRRNATALGDLQTTAAIHVFVAEMEAKRGALLAAERHLQIAERLLADAPNPWLLALAENVRLAGCIMYSEIDRGAEHGDRGSRFADESGTAAMRRALAANRAALCYLSGDFAQAVELIDSALRFVPSIGGARHNGCLETLARIRFAEDRLNDCAEILDRIEASIQVESDRTLYGHRHALLTRSLLLSRHGQFDEALRAVDLLLDLNIRAGDRFLLLTAMLTKIELLQRQSAPDEVRKLLGEVADDLAAQPTEIHAHYERVLACGLIRENEPVAAAFHYARAQRLCESIRSVPARLELVRAWSEAKSAHGVENPPAMAVADCAAVIDASRDVVQGMAALATQANRPDFVAREAVSLLIRTAVAESIRAVRRRADGSEETIEDWVRHDAVAGGRVRVFTIDSTPSGTIELAVRPRLDLQSIATVNAIGLVISTLRELSMARVEREERATIWPTDDVRPEGGRSVIAGHMREVIALAQRVARTTVNVLITGESGTGKEIVARAIHDCSDRAQKPFVPFNCAAVPRDLLESQLFGHRRGAFTGADRDYTGWIRSARDGTLFLDEIGELSLDLQPKLLRFLESGEISPLGELAPVTVNVRIVAATNANLEDAVREGRFREDLFYRLNVVRLSLRPLRERRDEIPGLVAHFVERAAREFEKGHLEVAEETMERLLLFRWPGNVRQLHNEIRRMVALAEPNSTLQPAMISEAIIRAMPLLRPPSSGGEEMAVRLTDKLLPTLSRVESEMIKVALRDNNGRIDDVARSLGISRKGLYLKRQRLGL